MRFHGCFSSIRLRLYFLVAFLLFLLWPFLSFGLVLFLRIVLFLWLVLFLFPFDQKFGFSGQEVSYVCGLICGQKILSTIARQRLYKSLLPSSISIISLYLLF